jgi:hypothetical protein
MGSLMHKYFASYITKKQPRWLLVVPVTRRQVEFTKIIDGTATRTPYFGEWAVHVATDGSR